MTALIIVDMQKDFCESGGSLYVKGAELITSGVVTQMTSGDYELVVLTQDWHPEETAHWNKWPVHCVEETWGAELVNLVASAVQWTLLDVTLPDPVFIRKGTGANEDGYSGFTVIDENNDRNSTGLNEVLHEHGVEDVAICGVAGDVCVNATALDAIEYGYDTKVLLPLTVSISSQGLIDCINHWQELGIEVLGANTTE